MKIKFFLIISVNILLVLNCSKNAVTPESNISTMIDVEGNVYQTVKIGNQEWMAENLRTTKFNDSSEIPFVTDSSEWGNLTTPGYCFYQNTTILSDIKKYGALYNWYAINTGKLAPNGWHIPTNDDWLTLEQYLIINGYNWDGSNDSNKIAKSLAAKTDWYTGPAVTTVGAISTDLSKNNKSGFSAMPGDFRYEDGSFHDLKYGICTNWWSASEYDTSMAYSWFLACSYDSLITYPYSNREGLSVRLLKNAD